MLKRWAIYFCRLLKSWRVKEFGVLTIFFLLEYSIINMNPAEKHVSGSYEKRDLHSTTKQMYKGLAVRLSACVRLDTASISWLRICCMKIFKKQNVSWLMETQILMKILFSNCNYYVTPASGVGTTAVVLAIARYCRSVLPPQSGTTALGAGISQVLPPRVYHPLSALT